MEIKNNFKMLGLVIVIIFIGIVVINERRMTKISQNIQKNKGTITGKTTGCSKSLKSSMFTIHYTFSYKNVQYYGSEDFAKRKRGDICNDYFFLVEFDTINPVNNRIILDSLRGGVSR